VLGRLHVREVIAEYPTLQIRLRKFNTFVFNTSVIAILAQSTFATRRDTHACERAA
jgi:hypothetical protein